MQKNLKRVISIYFMISICLCFSACGTVNEEQPVEESEVMRKLQIFWQKHSMTVSSF